MKNFYLLLVLCLLSSSMYSQHLGTVEFTRISQQLVQQYLESNYLDDESLVQKGNCVYDNTNSYALSCISSSWDLEWISDFNGDGINDLIIQITDEGLGGGGNAFGYSFEIVTLDNEKNIKESYSLFGGGKMSYALLSIDRVANGRIYATYEQNPHGYGFQEVTYDNQKQLPLEFYLEGQNILEKNYTKCPIAEMNKDVFKNDLDLEVKRRSSMDDSFNIEQTEQLYLKDNTHYNASITGCEDINLYFSHTIPFQSALESNTSAIKNEWLKHIRFLKEHTRYKSVFTELLTEVILLSPENIIIGEYGGADHQFELSNDWKCFLFVSGNDEQGSFITVRLVKSANPEPLEFWEALEKKSAL